MRSSQSAERMQGYDLSALDMTEAANAGAAVTLKHPVTGDALPVTITLLGSDSDRWRAEVRRQLDDRMNRRLLTPGAERLEAEAVERLAAVTVRWTGLHYHGEALACTRQNAARVYREQPWIREQLLEFVEERRNFFPTPSKT